MFDVPEGESTSDERWQMGYRRGEMANKPESEDPVYISGWCQGYCGAHQSTVRQAEKAFLDSLYSGGLE